MRGQHALQLAAAQRVARQEVGHVRNAQARDGGAQHGFHVVADQARRQLGRQAGQVPVLDLSAGHELVAQAAVAGEVGRHLRHAVPCQVGRRGREHEAERAEAARHELRIDQLAAADGHVDTLGHHVDQPVVEVEVEFDLGKARLERRQDRQQKAVADGRQAHAQAAARRGDGVLQHGARIAELVEDAAAALMEHRALGREPHLPRGAVEQPHAHLRLEPRHVLAHGRGRDAQVAARPRKALQVGRPHEGFESAEAVHGLDWQPGVGSVRS
ncbi:hypothetical protein D3C71_1120150 [compost metagenome]